MLFRSIFKTGQSTVQFDIAYFPKSKKDKNGEVNEVKTKLFRELRYAEKFRLVQKRAEVSDGVLHVTLTVKYNERIDEPVPLIEQYEIDKTIKEV